MTAKFDQYEAELDETKNMEIIKENIVKALSPFDTETDKIKTYMDDYTMNLRPPQDRFSRGRRPIEQAPAATEEGELEDKSMFNPVPE